MFWQQHNVFFLLLYLQATSTALSCDTQLAPFLQATTDPSILKTTTKISRVRHVKGDLFRVCNFVY